MPGKIPAHCVPEKPTVEWLNPRAKIPFGVTPEHVRAAMEEFTSFLGHVNAALCARDMVRLEDLLMPANFSSVVGEFVAASIPRYCPSVAKNAYHNGHPDLLPAGRYPKNQAQHAGANGIEIKASRYRRGWQGHNPEDVWLLVLVFSGGRPADLAAQRLPTPFRFEAVYGARLRRADWRFAGRSGTSRRTITASVTTSGYSKMVANWIYRRP